MKKLALILLITTLGCKNATNRDAVIGKWKLHKLDAEGEAKKNQDAGITVSTMDAQNLFMTLNADGIGRTWTGRPVTWEISGDGRSLMMTDSAGQKIGAFFIIEMDRSKLTLKDTTARPSDTTGLAAGPTGHPALFETFIKQ